MRRNRTQLMEPIRRGSTPTLFFDIPYEKSLIEGGYIVFSQRGETIIKKPFSDESVAIERRKLVVDLTEEETLRLTTADLCRAQMRFAFPYGKRGGSGIYKIPVLDVLEGGEV